MDKEEYLKHKEAVKKYEREVSSHLVKTRTCCVCKQKEIKPLYGDTIPPVKQGQGAWLDGVVQKITFGYGSIHEEMSFYIAVCDDCITKEQKAGRATNVYDIVKARNALMY